MDRNREPPNPERFKFFDELPDGSGFTLQDGTMFYFEETGGWYDEFGNYYNEKGEPDYYPVGNDYEDILDEYDLGDGGEDDYADYEREIQQQSLIFIKSLELIANVNSHKDGDNIVIYFSNMNFKASKDDIINFLFQGKNYVGLKTVEIDYYPDSKKKVGTGKIVATKKECALKIIEKNGQKLLNERPLFFQMDDFEANENIDLDEEDSNLKVFDNKIIGNAQVVEKKIENPIVKELEKNQKPKETKEKVEKVEKTEKKEEKIQKIEKEEKIGKEEKDPGDSWGIIPKKPKKK